MCRLVVGGFTVVFLATFSAADRLSQYINFIGLGKPFAIRRNDADTLSVFVYYKERVNFDQAAERCAVAGAELLTPEDSIEAKAVSEWVDYIWTGIRDWDYSGVYQILDGRLLSATDLKWYGYKPHPNEGKTLCAAFGQAGPEVWSYDCRDKVPYVCKFRITVGSTAPEQ